MFRRYLTFLRCVSVNRVGRLGVTLTTSSVVAFVLLELLRILGVVTNAYVGLITYMAFPALFIAGLLLIPIGWQLLRRQTGRSARELLESRFDADAVRGRPLGSSLFKTVALLTLANVVILGVASARMLHFMEQPVFCGTACHSVMGPEWATYQESPHARVPCVDCHVGEGAEAQLNAKLNGLWQIISITFGLVPRPIPTPVHQLRPARETCEKCHWPEKFYGTQLETSVRYAMDRESTSSYTTLALKIDAGRGGARSGIHWHIGTESTVRYASVEDMRREIVWVESRQPDGGFKRWTNRRMAGQEVPEEHVRTMDCVDCHNRATHIYEAPERALDERIARGLLDRELPFIKREALRAITAGYPDRDAAMAGIGASLHGFYRRYDDATAARLADRIDDTADVLRAVWNRNVHPGMNVGWGSYPSHLGHRDGGGCFRCHSPDLVAEDGGRISDDCTLCHSILAQEAAEPFRYLRPVEDEDPDRDMHYYLQQEFLESLTP